MSNDRRNRKTSEADEAATRCHIKHPNPAAESMDNPSRILKQESLVFVCVCVFFFNWTNKYLMNYSNETGGGGGRGFVKCTQHNVVRYFYLMPISPLYKYEWYRHLGVFAAVNNLPT